MKSKLFALPLVTLGLAFASNASAQTIVWDFNDNDAAVDSNGFSGLGVTTDDVAITGSGVNPKVANQRIQRDLGTNQSIQTATFSYTLNIGATPIDLTQIDFISGLEVNSGSATTNYWKWDLVITTTGSETPGASQTTFDRSQLNNNAVQFSETATLSGLENISNVSVTFAFTGFYGINDDYSGGQNNNRFVYMDDVTFTGDFGAATPATLQLSDFTYDPVTGDSEVTIEAAADTDYKLVEAADLDFASPDQDPVPLTGASVGTLNGSKTIVTTDSSGKATVQFDLGTAKSATFIRAETP